MKYIDVTTRIFHIYVENIEKQEEEKNHLRKYVETTKRGERGKKVCSNAMGKKEEQSH